MDESKYLFWRLPAWMGYVYIVVVRGAIAEAFESLCCGMFASTHFGLLIEAT